MSVYDNLKPIDLSEIKTYELESRPSKVTVADFAVFSAVYTKRSLSAHGKQPFVLRPA